ncbi:choline-sulfatase [Pokkaliibacter sp. CJK22405]|uniref:choline-sulfatase n=1 Tax=Pokkaliibacter sp. CJK22405 TaxID=3384615 RepID=UPI0039847CD5
METPNILFIMADQMAAPILPLYSDSVVKTPNLSALAEQSVIFDSAYCNSPLCAPSRFTLMSGLLPSKIRGFDNAAEFPADTPTFAHYLRSAGYKTALSGKMHFCGPDQLHGFEERLTSDIYPADFGWAVDWDHADDRPTWYHNMSSVTQAGPSVRTNQLDFDEETVFKARQYLYDHARSNDKRPFCLTVSMTHPHDPYTITKEFWDLYEDVDIPLPENIPAQDSLDPQSQRLLKVYDLWNNPMKEEDIRRARRAYFGSISYVDSKIGELLKTLKDCELDDNTIIVFSGDHGDMLGEKGMWYKMSWFEMSSRVPMLVKMPGAKPGRVSSSVSTMDLLPTFAEMAGVPLAQGLPMDGRSLMPHLSGVGGHDEVFGEYMGEGTTSPMMMIRRGPLKFIYSEQDPCMLFDLSVDPKESNNVVNHPDYQQAATELLEEARKKWDIPAITEDVLQSQRRRRFVAAANAKGKITSWDHQPMVDASEQYMRNHIDLDDLEKRARFPQV